MIFKVLVHGKFILTIAINSISSKNAEEEHLMYLISNNIKFTSYSDADEVKSLCSKYQEHLETLMKGIDFIFLIQFN